MQKVMWSPVGEFALETVAAARLQAHYAVQVVAGVGRALLPQADDDSHTSLSWDDTHGAFVGQPLLDGRRAGLRVADLTLLLLSPDGSQVTQTLDKLTLDDAAAWFATALGADPAAIRAIPYNLPSHALVHGAGFDPGRHARALAALSAWYRVAEEALAALTAAFERNLDAVSPIRTWPHHFDHACLFYPTAARGEAAASVGSGLSPGDDTYSEPYLYVSPWPYPSSGALAALPAGHWHTAGFTAAVLPATTIAGSGNARNVIADFLQAGLTASLQALSDETR
ncbi:MAG: hypothetical protein AAGF46_06730 [Pseudomonadota bacterium]